MPDCHHCGATVAVADAYCADCGVQLGAPPDGPPESQPGDAARADRPRRPDSPSQTVAGPAGSDELPTPDSLKLACALLAILGLLSGLAGVGAIRAQQAFGSIPSGYGGPYGTGGGVQVGLLVTGVLALALGVAYLASAYGLWRARSWAWNATLVTTGAGTLLFLVAPSGGGLGALSALASGGLCAYLVLAGEACRPAVRFAVARRQRAEVGDREPSGEGF